MRGTEGAPSGIRRPRKWLKWSAVGLAVLAAGTAGVGWAAYEKLDGNITPDTRTAAELSRYEKERPTALVRDAQNILLIGSDTRSGAGNLTYGRNSGSEHSDTTILLHLAADRRSATAVSLPRDLMVNVPSCLRRDGTRTKPVFTVFNHAYQTGGPACTIRTVEKLTDIRVDHHIVVDFRGFKEMVDALDGVEVCMREPINDEAAKLRLPAGKVRLGGEQALGYVRARKSLGDGSDTERMDRQQQFLGALVSKVKSNGVLLSPARLYPVLDAATSALTTDPELASLRGLYDLVRGMRMIPTGNVQFLTAPRRSYPFDTNRDQLVEPAAEKLFAQLRADAPVTVVTENTEYSGPKSRNAAPEAGDRSEHMGGENPYKEPNAHPHDYSESPGDTREEGSRESDPAPTFRGSTAAEGTCR
ncbi:LCP family protein [Streptomyces acidicola]|uniref:LytR family transcriptional regulator n=1 Tax=Streptomyces acidicola TaxID=2596892 RepID=A0A5N8WSZ3_9ACTN|nr:LCP family protein [Streptomyces acidicola]MPY49936.1 LytR family transcriptional regulator [Streptomyces acidicola]